MRNSYTSGSIVANRKLIAVIGRSPNKAKIWSWDCALCGSPGKPMNTTSLARCIKKNSTPRCCNFGKNNKHFVGTEHLSQDYITRLKRMAGRAGREFSVDIDYLDDLLVSQDFRCALSGKPLPPRIGRARDGASLDRIDSSKGYVPGNVQWVYTKINSMKSDLPQEEFIELCKLVAAHH